MQNKITHFDDLPEEVKKQFKLEHIHISLNKHDRCGRTCRNCTHSFLEAKGKVGCYMHDEQPARNTRARALKCKHFEHWRKALDKFIF